MDFNRITELGMEKVAANPNVAGLLPGGQKQGLSKKQLAKLLAGGAGLGAAGAAGAKKLSDEQKQALKERGKGALAGAASTGAGVAGLGALGTKLTGGKVDPQKIKRLAGQGAAFGGVMGALRPDKALGKKKEKQASAEELYIDGLQKIASVTGIEPEVLDEAIGVYNEEMTKEAEVNNFLDSISEEEAGEILKEAAQSSPELKGKISELEEQEENEDLGNLVSTIEGMSDEEAKKLLEEIE
jgi:hypothetical protein